MGRREGSEGEVATDLTRGPGSLGIQRLLCLVKASAVQMLRVISHLSRRASNSQAWGPGSQEKPLLGASLEEGENRGREQEMDSSSPKTT